MRVLVIGDGLLGKEIIRQTGWDYISRKKDGIDFSNIETYKNYLDGYDTILNCVANTNTYSEDKEGHRDTNFLSVKVLSDYLKSKNKKLIHISTDYVYVGSKPFCSEDGMAIPDKNWYSYYKLLADEYVSETNDNYLICRCSFKPNPFPYDKAWVDQFGCFDYVDIISEIIIDLIKHDMKGIYNVGTELKSIYELAKRTNDTVKKAFKPDFVPANTSLNLDKLNKFYEERSNNISIR
jgi:dTDP-4-dehydrorhamnose reductase